jgi:predicted nucleic acid-binding protein/L-amino acid N-acyltransferase YncA
MKALLDTNIIIHREAGRIVVQDIGILFKWLDKAQYQKCIHPATVDEINKNPNKETVKTFNTKLDSYETLKTIAPLAQEVKAIGDKYDKNENDKVDTLLLNELHNNRVDVLITEDRKIHVKARELNISERVFTIDSFLEKIVSEYPDLVDYKVLGVTKKYFGELNLNDAFFDSFKEDYTGFEAWFNGKANDALAYVTLNDGRLLSFLYMKVEDERENYADITPVFSLKKRLKIGTFKVISNGVRLGERFLKIIFDNARQFKVDEIYVTIFDKREEQKRLIALLEEWGFVLHGTKQSKSGTEQVYVRDFRPAFNISDPKKTFPYFSANNQCFMVSIYPEYHTELLPDSYLKTESPKDYVEHKPHRNALSKVFISRSLERDVKKGDILVFYRTADTNRGSAYHTSVITTIAIIEGKVDGIRDEKEFIMKCRKRSIFTDEELKKHWDYNSQFRPFIINFLYVLSFLPSKRLTRKKLLELGILTGEKNELRGLKRLNTEQFELLIKETATHESIIVH